MKRNTRRVFMRGAIGAPAILSGVGIGMANEAAPASGSGTKLEQFPGLAYRNYPRCLPDYLRSLANASYLKRNEAVAALTSPAAIRRRQQWARKTLLELVGPLPEKTDLNPKVTGSIERDGYRVEKIVYESRPKLHVPANLYIPTSGKGPFPAVLFQLGHSLNGKAYHSYQRATQGLAKLGFLVLGFDPMGQGERVYYPDSGGLVSRFGDADAEHTFPGRQMLLAGTTCTQFQLWDAIRSLDYLASHPLADKTRLASTGQSGGATLTMLLCAVDDRLRTAAVFSGNTENVACKNFLPPGSTDDAEQDLVGGGPLGFDRWDLLYPFAPKPLLISVSDKDYFGTYSPNYIANGWEEYKKLAGVYRVLGAVKNLALSDTPLPHGLSYDSRLQMYNWFLRHLADSDKQVEQEPDVKPEDDATLYVSSSGNMVRSFGGETPFSLTKQRAAAISEEAKPARLDELIRLERASHVRASVLTQVPSAGGVTIAAIDFGISPQLGLPAWLFRPKDDSASKPVLLVLHPHGRNSAWHEDQLYPSLARQGALVCAADVRGIGDLTQEFSPGNPGYQRSHQTEEAFSWSSLILGRPLVGQRVADILTIVQGLHTIKGLEGRKIVLAALDGMTIPGLFAASLEQRITKLYLAGGLSSYRSIVDTEDYRHSLAGFVPNILAHTDLPQIVAQLAPRPVIIAGPVDGAGATLSPESSREIYKQALTSGHLQLREHADWDEGALGQLAAG